MRMTFSSSIIIDRSIHPKLSLSSVEDDEFLKDPAKANGRIREGDDEELFGVKTILYVNHHLIIMQTVFISLLY